MSQTPFHPPLCPRPVRPADVPKPVMTVNNQKPDEHGNVNVEGGGGEGDVKHSDFADMQPGGKMDLDTVSQKVDTLIHKLKGTASLAFALLSLSSFAALGPTTRFGAVHPDTTLREVVVAGGVPTKVSDLTNDLGFVDKAVTNGLASVSMLPTKVSDLTNDLEFVDETVTNIITSRKRDLDDLRVYRKANDCWVWTNWTNPMEPDAKPAPADFLAFANSPGSKPIYFEHDGWFGGTQFWPNGKRKYMKDPGPGGLGKETDLNFAFTAYDETGTNELFRFGAHAHRDNPTNETFVSWSDRPVNEFVRVATTDMVDWNLAGKTGTNDFVTATNDLWNARGGGMRLYPKYLEFMEVADAYPEEAKMYYDQAFGPAACSSYRDGGFHYRNYDWNFDSSCVFVVSTLAGPGRFASIGVGGVGTNLTEEIVSSGERTKWYKAVPGHMLDGINENGVCININVISSHGYTNGWHGVPATDGIHCLAAIRWTLDNATNAQHAATELARRVYVPQAALDKGYSFHYMVSDEDSTWIAEDGQCRSYPGRIAMTNVRSLDENDPCGTGRERLAILNGGGSITDVWFTKAYTDETNARLSEFVVTGTETEEELMAAWQAAHDLWATKPKEAHRGESFSGTNWWQTVHTSIYDLTNRTLRVAVQERDDWYTFQVPASAPKIDAYTKAEVDEKIGDLQNYDIEQDSRINSIGAALASKIGKVGGAVADNFAALTDDGNIKDSGKKSSDFITKGEDNTQSGGYFGIHSAYTGIGFDGGTGIGTLVGYKWFYKDSFDESRELAVKGDIPDVSGKADAATGLTPGTKCKITYNQQGIVTAGANLTASDIPPLAASKINSGTFPDARIASASIWNSKPTQNDLKAATNAVARAAKGFADNIAVVGNGFMLGTPYTAQGTEGNSFRSIGFGDGVWIAGDVAGNLLRSETGTNGWEICKAADPARRYARAIRYRDGLWTAAFRGGQVLYSMDGGTSWIQVDIGREIYDICYDPFSNDWFAAVEGGVVRCEFGDDQTFIATVTPRQVAVSDEGTVVIGSAEAGSGLWYARPGETVFRHSNVTVGNFRCLTYMHGQFIAGQYGTEGGGGIWRSVDGITWEKVDSRASTYYCCTWASGQWVMTSTYFGHIAYSANGIDWTWCDRPDSVNVVIHSCANGNGLTLFCRNADDGSTGGISVAKIGRYVRSNWFYSKDELDAMIPPVYIPSESDPAFSNAVLKVGISTNALVVAAQLESLGTNTVAQIADFVSAFDGIGITLPQGATTLAGLLAALLAAVTWLKKTLGKVADNSGKPTDDFAGELMGKPVAKEAIRANSAQLALDDDGEIIVTMNTED